MLGCSQEQRYQQNWCQVPGSPIAFHASFRVLPVSMDESIFLPYISDPHSKENEKCAFYWDFHKIILLNKARNLWIKIYLIINSTLGLSTIRNLKRKCVRSIGLQELFNINTMLLASWVITLKINQSIYKKNLCSVHWTNTIIISEISGGFKKKNVQPVQKMWNTTVRKWWSFIHASIDFYLYRFRFNMLRSTF